MAKRLERKSNTTDTAILSSGIILNTSTSVKIADANDDRIAFYLSNDSFQDIWLKLQAASVDNDQKGILIFRRSVYEMPRDNWYTGEISAMADTGSPIIFVTEY